VLGARGRPLIVGEFGCCTYAGADRLGGSNDIVDHAVTCLAIFDAGGVGELVKDFPGIREVLRRQAVATLRSE
jgi:hypothetical protein